MTVSGWGSLSLHQLLWSLANYRMLLYCPPFPYTFYQGVTNLKHEKLLLMKVAYKAFKSLPGQSIY